MPPWLLWSLKLLLLLLLLSAHSHVFLHFLICSLSFMRIHVFLTTPIVFSQIFSGILCAFALFFERLLCFGMSVFRIFCTIMGYLSAFAKLLHAFSAHAHVFMHLRACSTYFPQSDVFLPPGIFCACAPFSAFAHQLYVFSAHAQFCPHLRTISTCCLVLRRFFSVSDPTPPIFCSTAPRVFLEYACFSAFAHLLHLFYAHAHIFFVNRLRDGDTSGIRTTRAWHVSTPACYLLL